MSELAIVLATYNEASNLPLLVGNLEALPSLDLQLLIVDDSSPDGTYAVAQDLSKRYKNITVICRPGKLGLGSALRDGISAALNTDCRYVMTMDADCSHDPQDVPRLLEAMRSGGVDMVQGSRYVPQGGVRGWGFGRRWLSRSANLLYHRCAGAPHESTTDFRIFSRRASSVVLVRARGRDYEFMPEAPLLVLAAGLQIREVPIIFTERAHGRSKLGKREAVKAVTSFATSTFQYRLGLGRFQRQSVTDRESGGDTQP